MPGVLITCFLFSCFVGVASTASHGRVDPAPYHACVTLSPKGRGRGHLDNGPLAQSPHDEIRKPAKERLALSTKTSHKLLLVCKTTERRHVSNTFSNRTTMTGTKTLTIALVCGTAQAGYSISSMLTTRRKDSGFLHKDEFDPLLAPPPADGRRPKRSKHWPVKALTGSPKAETARSFLNKHTLVATTKER